MPELCQSITKAGRRCDRPVLTGKRHCLFHDPESSELRLAGSRAGGRNRANAARAAKALPPAFTTEELMQIISDGIWKVRSGAMDPGVLNALYGAARAMDAIRKSTELETRIEQLEQRAGVRGAV